MAILLLILKILLIILLVVLGIILVVMILPIGAEVSFIDGKLKYKVRVWLLNVMDSDGGGVVNWFKKWKKKRKKKEKSEPAAEKKPRRQKKRKSVVDDDDYLNDFDFGEDDDIFVPSETQPEISVTSAETESEKKSEDIPTVQAEVVSEGEGTSDDEDNDLFEDEDEEEETSDNDDKRSLGDWAELGISVWECAQRPMLRIFKAFLFDDLYIDFVICNEDAYDCALKYGKYSGMIYNIIAFMSLMFTVRLKTVDIGCGFGLKKSRWDAAVKLYFRTGALVIAGLWFALTFAFKIFIPNKIKKIRRKKSAARQK